MEQYLVVVIIIIQSVILVYAGDRHSRVGRDLKRIKKNIEKGASLEVVSDEVEEVIKEYF